MPIYFWQLHVTHKIICMQLKLLHVTNGLSTKMLSLLSSQLMLYYTKRMTESQNIRKHGAVIITAQIAASCSK